MMELQPYVFFYGKCEEALHFYKGIFGGTINSISRMKEAPPDMPAPPDWGDKIMHARFESGTLKFMASDGRPDTPNVDGNISLSLSTRDEAEATRVFDKLSEGGEVSMPLSDMFWNSKFGVLKDKYGIEWFINCERS
jgi:PhnB protein